MNLRTNEQSSQVSVQFDNSLFRPSIILLCVQNYIFIGYGEMIINKIVPTHKLYPCFKEEHPTRRSSKKGVLFKIDLAQTFKKKKRSSNKNLGNSFFNNFLFFNESISKFHFHFIPKHIARCSKLIFNLNFMKKLNAI